MAAETVAASSLGRVARRVLGEGGRGQVVAAFRRALYVEGPGGMLCLGRPAIGDGPLNLLVALPAGFDGRGFRAGQAAALAPDRLGIEGGLVVSTLGASVWRPPPVPRWERKLAHGLAALARLACPPAEGLAFALPGLLGGTPAPGPSGPFRRAARTGLAALSAWLRTGGAAPVEGLIGLGPGLTPAGDDALGGAMIALRRLGSVAAADALARACLAHAATRTSAIARAHLAAAAEGEGAAAFHAVLAALAAGNEQVLARTLPALARIGHSSGWDSLVGAVLVLGALAAGDDAPRDLGGDGGTRRDDHACRLEPG